MTITTQPLYRWVSALCASTHPTSSVTAPPKSLQFQILSHNLPAVIPRTRDHRVGRVRSGADLIEALNRRAIIRKLFDWPARAHLSRGLARDPDGAAPHIGP